MADAAVEFLLSKVNDLLKYHSHLITDTKSQIESLVLDLRRFKAYLVDSVERRKKDERTRVVVQNIHNIVYKLEDIIEAFFTQVAQIESQSWCTRPWRSKVNLHSFGLKVEEIAKEVERCKVDFTSLDVTDEDKPKKPERPQRVKVMVGYKDVTEEIKSRLAEETEYLDVIALVGMFGLGKTTLADKIYEDPKIIEQFPVRIWLWISQEFSGKDKFLAIIENFTTLTEDICKRDDHVLSRMASDYLQDKKFLIVMDDVWYTTDWDRLSSALPVNYKGKVLITSRDESVGRYANRHRAPLKLRNFSKEESWELLRLEALGKLDCPTELEDVGRKIADECKGIPLEIVVIGGILAAESSASDVNEARKEWEKVPTRVSTYLSEDDRAKRMNKFISLSYDILPDHLRACFLYLAMFPEDYEIPVAKLICMWIGEGFILQQNKFSLEEIAEKYLKDLINQNLVKIERLKADGKVKTCRIHDSLRDFCISESSQKGENFLHEIKFKDEDSSPPISDLSVYHRISIHSNCLNFICSTKPASGPRVRSFVSFSSEECTLPEGDSSAIPAAFRMLRVLDVKPIKFTKIPSDMYQLIHLRYVALSLNFSTLPSKFSRIWNIQTLIVDTTSQKLEVKADICKMRHLRHFKTNPCATLPKPSENSKHCAELQSLGAVSAESCTAELLDRARNINKLSIHGQLALFLEGRIGSFGSLAKLKKLEKLKLINDAHCSPSSGSRLVRPPEPYQFPSKLKSLTLCATTFLSWSYTSTLGLLDNLEVLKLKDDALMGDTWEIAGVGFPRLEFLHIEKTHLVSWKASSEHLPRLRGIVLRYCEKLVDIPIELADIKSLKTLDLDSGSSAAAVSARNIEAKKNKQGEGGGAFKLSISRSN